MKWVIVFWLVGLLPEGTTDDHYQMIMFEPEFKLRSECELYMIQRKDEWMAELFEQAQLATRDNWVGIALEGDPWCQQFDKVKMELRPDGPSI